MASYQMTISILTYQFKLTSFYLHSRRRNQTSHIKPEFPKQDRYCLAIKFLSNKIGKELNNWERIGQSAQELFRLANKAC